MLIVGVVWVVAVLVIVGFFNGAGQVNEQWDRGSERLMKQICQGYDMEGVGV